MSSTSRRIVRATAALCVSVGLAGGALATEAEPGGPGITKDQAAQIALKALPGKVTDISVERKRGQDVYVVEIVSANDAAETDVLVDPQSGKVLGME